MGSNNSGSNSPTLAVGCGAGFSGDRIDAPGPVVRTLIERGGPAVMMFEMLAERTLALAQLARKANPELGYETLLELVLRPILADCINHNITIVGNFGAANPRGAAAMIHRLARELGLRVARIAVVEGDDLSGVHGRQIVRDALQGDFDERRFVCANAYQGAFAIADAITAGAQVVVTGRVADPSLTLAPAIAHLGGLKLIWTHGGATWRGTCSMRRAVTEDISPTRLQGRTRLDDVGFPIAEIASDGSCGYRPRIRG